MLKFAKDMDEDTRIKCMIAGWLAVDENCGVLNPNSHPVRLRRSNGHSKTGRARKYFLYGVTTNSIIIRAFDDEKALEIANGMIE